jgi:hypothetical protein
MTRRAIASGVAVALMYALAGCAIRQDATGVSRVGVFLWGFGDPPGVNWNLDGPRREVLELPAAPRRELPPREPARTQQKPDTVAPNRTPPDGAPPAIGDNPIRVSRSALESTAVPVSRRAVVRDSDAAAR